MLVAVPIFDGITALDAVGPYEVLSRLPRAQVVFVASEPGVKRTDDGMLGLVADRGLDEVASCDVVVVPGGPGVSRAMLDASLLSWLRAVGATATWTTSVCTGALVLAAAGLLEGRRATTHWLSVPRLAELGAVVDPARVVVDGRVMTAAGVSAGIDMALVLAEHLAGRQIAEAVQLSIEYDPDPPFRSGNPATASADTVALVTAATARQAARASR